MEPVDDGFDEKIAVYGWRYDQARDAGLTIAEAMLFASSDTDVGVLRKLVRDECPVGLIREIVL